MKKSEFVILVDMDDVLENLIEAWVNRLNEKYNRNVKVEDVQEWDICKYFPGLEKSQVHSPLFEDNFWSSVQPKRDAMLFLEKLHNEGFSIFIVTSSHYSTLGYKFEQALWPYFPFIDKKHIIVCDVKQLIKGDVLIDDGIHNLLNYENIKPSYYKILYTTNHNKNIDTVKQGIKRVSNWNEIYTIIEGLYVKNELEKMSTK